MIPIKEHTQRMEQHRTTQSTEITELSANKLTALSERDEALNKISVLLQDCRREAYTLRRIASNMAIHSDADIRPTDHSRSPSASRSSSTNRPVADIFNAAGETGKICCK